MATTPARRARRAQEQAIRLKEESNNLIVKDLKDLYKDNPNKALEFAFSVVGREKYQEALRFYLERYLAPVAFVYAMRKCLRGGENDKHEDSSIRSVANVQEVLSVESPQTQNEN